MSSGRTRNDNDGPGRIRESQPDDANGSHRVVFHVLGGRLSPLDGIGPDDLRIKELLERLDGVTEIIIATNPNVEGEATADAGLEGIDLRVFGQRGAGDCWKTDVHRINDHQGFREVYDARRETIGWSLPDYDPAREGAQMAFDGRMSYGDYLRETGYALRKVNVGFTDLTPAKTA